MLSVLGRTWNLCWRSWAALGAYVGGLGPLLEPMLAVLGRSWSLCWRSEAGLGIYAGGPERPERWEAGMDPIALRAPYAFFL